MKRILLIITLMIFSSQVFAQKDAKTQKVKTKSNNANEREVKSENGIIDAFVYENNFLIDAPEICKNFGIESLTILKGKYEVDRSDESQGGKITLNLKPIKLINRPKVLKDQAFRSRPPAGETCKGPGSACFFNPDGSPTKEQIHVFTLNPIIENGLMTKIEVQYKSTGSPKNAGF